MPTTFRDGDALQIHLWKKHVHHRLVLRRQPNAYETETMQRFPNTASVVREYERRIMFRLFLPTSWLTNSPRQQSKLERAEIYSVGDFVLADEASLTKARIGKAAQRGMRELAGVLLKI